MNGVNDQTKGHLSVQVMQTETQNIGAYCSLLRRLGVMLYDSLIAVVLMFLVTVGWLPFTGGEAISTDDPRHIYYQLSLLLIIWLYLALSWRLGGQTLGARAWRVRLLSQDNSPVGWWQSTVRIIVAVTGLAVFGIGFLWSLFHPQKATWHDLASQTQLFRQSTD